MLPMTGPICCIHPGPVIEYMLDNTMFCVNNVKVIPESETDRVFYIRTGYRGYYDYDFKRKHHTISERAHAGF